MAPRYLVRLPHAALRARVSVSTMVQAAIGGRPPEPHEVAAFALTRDERRFVDELSRRHDRFWIYRSHQKRYCGDFALVDMSSPRPCRRTVWIVDLKHAARLRLGGGGAGVQLRNRDAAIAELVADGVADADSPACAVVGDRRVVLAHLLS